MTAIRPIGSALAPTRWVSSELSSTPRIHQSVATAIRDTWYTYSADGLLQFGSPRDVLPRGQQFEPIALEDSQQYAYSALVPFVDGDPNRATEFFVMRRKLGSPDRIEVTGPYPVVTDPRRLEIR